MANVEIYTKGYCPFCTRAKALLEQKLVTYQEIKIDEQPELRSVMIERSQGGYTVPQVFINNISIGGCDELYALEMQGKLSALLEAE